MDGILLVQGRILAQMRATSRVAEARHQLGLTPDVRTELDGEASALGLGEPAHPMELYRRLLGDPVSRENVVHVNPYARRVDCYALPLWPGFAFRVSGSEDGVVGEVGFRSWVPQALLCDAAALEPWAAVRDQLEPILATGTVIDEWFPMRDYKVPTGVPAGRALLLRFDFDMLQEVSVVGPEVLPAASTS